MTWFEIVPIVFDSELSRASKLLNVPQINPACTPRASDRMPPERRPGSKDGRSANKISRQVAPDRK